jgi:hypothetical protein
MTLRANDSTPAGDVRCPTPTAAVELDDAGEQWMVLIDEPGDCALATARAHREMCDGDGRADPDARVASEQQVRQWRDDEVGMVEHPRDESVVRRCLVSGHARDDHPAELFGGQRREVLAQGRCE